MAEPGGFWRNPEAKGYIKIGCTMCKQEQTIGPVSVGQLDKWREGMKVQDAFPEMSPSDRELLISNTCERCWNKLFPPEEEEI